VITKGVTGIDRIRSRTSRKRAGELVAGEGKGRAHLDELPELRWKFPREGILRDLERSELGELAYLGRYMALVGESICIRLVLGDRTLLLVDWARAYSRRMPSRAVDPQAGFGQLTVSAFV